MARYILKRLFAMIPTLLGVAVLIFLLLRVVPGDVVYIPTGVAHSFKDMKGFRAVLIRFESK